MARPDPYTTNYFQNASSRTEVEKRVNGIEEQDNKYKEKGPAWRAESVKQSNIKKGIPSPVRENASPSTRKPCIMTAESMGQDKAKDVCHLGGFDGCYCHCNPAAGLD